MSRLRINSLTKTELPDIFKIDYMILKSEEPTEYVSKEISIYNFFDFDEPVENIEIKKDAFEGLTIPEFRVPKGFKMPKHLFGSKNTVVEKLIIANDYEWPKRYGDSVLAHRFMDSDVYKWRIKTLVFEDDIKVFPGVNVIMDLDEIKLPDDMHFGKPYPLINIMIPYLAIPDGEKELENYDCISVKWLSIPDSIKKIKNFNDWTIENIIFKGEIDSIKLNAFSNFDDEKVICNVFTKQPEMFKDVLRINLFDLNSFDTIAEFFLDFKMSEIQKIESFSFPFLTSQLYISQNNTLDLETKLKQSFLNKDSDISDESLANVIEMKKQIEALNIIGEESMFRIDGNLSDESCMDIVGKESMFKHKNTPRSVADIITIDNDSDTESKSKKCKTDEEIVNVFGINSN